MEEIMKIKISNTMKFWKMVKFKKYEQKPIMAHKIQYTHF